MCFWSQNLLGFIPCDYRGQSYLVHPCEEGQEGKNKGCDKVFVLIEDRKERLLRLKFPSKVSKIHSNCII